MTTSLRVQLLPMDNYTSTCVSPLFLSPEISSSVLHLVGPHWSYSQIKGDEGAEDCSSAEHLLRACQPVCSSIPVTLVRKQGSKMSKEIRVESGRN